MTWFPDQTSQAYLVHNTDEFGIDSVTLPFCSPTSAGLLNKLQIML